MVFFRDKMWRGVVGQTGWQRLFHMQLGIFFPHISCLRYSQVPHHCCLVLYGCQWVEVWVILFYLMSEWSASCPTVNTIRSKHPWSAPSAFPFSQTPTCLCCDSDFTSGDTGEQKTMQRISAWPRDRKGSVNGAVVRVITMECHNVDSVWTRSYSVSWKKPVTAAWCSYKLAARRLYSKDLWRVLVFTSL